MIESTENRVPTSPARRLKQFIEYCRKKNNGTVVEAVASWIGGHPTDSIANFKAWLEILHSARSAVSALERLDPLLRKGLAPGTMRVAGTFNSFPIHEPLHNLTRQLHTGDEEIIGLAAEALDSIRYELEFTDEELGQLATSLQEVSAEIQSSDELPVEVKEFGRQAVEDLSIAFKNYKVAGADGISDALAKSYGRWLLHWKTLEAYRGEKDSPVMKLYAWILALHAAVCLVKDSSGAGLFLSQLVEGNIGQ